MASLMEYAKAKVIAFWIECDQVKNNQTYTSQLHLLKMIHLTTVNNKTTSETLRNNLLSYAANVKNQQNSNFLWCQLFKTQGKRERVWQQYAYFVDGLCSKQRLYLFKYAHDWHTNYFDGKLSANFDHVKPRRRLKAKFNYLVYQGTCGALSPKQEQIVFLTMQLKQASQEMLHSLKWWWIEPRRVKMQVPCNKDP